MAKLSLHPLFIKDSLLVFKERGLRGLLFGTSVRLNEKEKQLLRDVENDLAKYRSQGARCGTLTKVDAIHKGTGKVYLLPNTADGSDATSTLLFDESTRITNGPDLWVYLSDSADPKKSLGNFHNLGLIKGNKGGQVYSVNKSQQDLTSCRTVIIYCKQFDVLFSFAVLE